VSPIAKLFGVTVPVLASSAFCLSVPFILLIADTAVLTATLFVFLSERRRIRPAPEIPVHADAVDVI
jgi:hypothetical protein